MMESDGTDYERLRLENIKRNTEFLESIGIDNVKVMMQTPKKSSASQKGSKKKAHKTRSIPARRSSRITLLSLQNMMEEAKETGNTALLEEAELKLKQLDLPIEDQSPLVVNNQIKEEQVQREFLDDGFMNLLEQMEPTESQKTLLAKTAEYSKLSLSEDQVAKVTNSRITVSFIHPSTSKLLIAAGDKEGYLGLWAPDDNDALYLSRPHSSNICSIFVNPVKLDQLWSVSYDCTLRYTNIEQKSFVQSYRVESEGYVTDAAHTCVNSSSSVYVSLSTGDVQMIDVRAPSCQWSSEVYDGKLNSIELNPIDENIMLTAGKAGYVGLHDIRMHSKKWKPLHLLLGNSLSVNSAAFSPDGRYIVSAGMDNTIQVWSDFHQSSLGISHVSRRHNNRTGRWLSTLRPFFDPKLSSTFIIGSMEQPRRIEVFTIDNFDQKSNEANNESNDGSNKKRKVDSIQLLLAKDLMSENLASVCSRNAIHPSLNVVVGGNSSGRVHIFREDK